MKPCLIIWKKTQGGDPTLTSTSDGFQGSTTLPAHCITFQRRLASRTKRQKRPLPRRAAERCDPRRIRAACWLFPWTKQLKGVIRGVSNESTAERGAGSYGLGKSAADDASVRSLSSASNTATSFEPVEWPRELRRVQIQKRSYEHRQLMW